MIELFKNGLLGQYQAALSMFHACVARCPEDKWEGHIGSFPFWHVAYHTLYYTDLYLSPDEDSFNPPSFYRENYQFFGCLPWPPHETVVADVPYDRDVILEYVHHCKRKASASIAAETPESLQGASGFWWYEIPRAEFHLNNVRHVQHHGAHMSLYLRRLSDIEIGWVASGIEDESPES